jgi:2,3-diketo-5-methylthio-1-phosphopentane phosphatase
MEKTKLSLICDFDGTITRTDVGHQVYTRFGDERWEAINKRWRRGEISSRDCLIGEYSFVHASEHQVREHIMKMKIDPAFTELVSICRENDIPIAVASDGFDFYIHALLEKYGLVDIEVFCNQMKFNGKKVELSFPYYEQGCGICGNCKALHVRKFKNEGRKVIYVGDGLSDRFAARASHIVFAKGELKDYLVDNQIDFMGFDDLSDVYHWMRDLINGKISITCRRTDLKDPCFELLEGES